MGTNKSIVIFENEPVRRAWSEKEEKWYFSVVDVVGVLAQNDRPRKYWDDLKRKLKQEGSEVSEKIGRLKLEAPDGKMRATDVADAEALFRIIQSVPSPKAEPFKIWLAKVGYERLKETSDPEIAVNRARQHWLTMGRSTKWIEQRMRGQEIRNKLTDYWSEHAVDESVEYAALTDIIHREWAGVTTKEHKQLKNLRGHNLRDHMSDEELLFTTLAELSTRGVAEKILAVGFDKNAVAAKVGGQVSKRAKNDFEKLTGKKVINGKNFLGQGEEIKKIRE